MKLLFKILYLLPVLLVLSCGLVRLALILTIRPNRPLLPIPAGNVGIGTTLQQTGLSIMNGNVAIGTWAAVGGGLLANGAGNVGIGSIWPGKQLDVTGTIRTTGLTISGFSPISGYVLTASDSAGDTTWSSAGGVSGWTVTGSNVYETGNGNVGIGTTLLTTAALTVMNGNVGMARGCQGLIFLLMETWWWGMVLMAYQMGLHSMGQLLLKPFILMVLILLQQAKDFV